MRRRRAVVRQRSRLCRKFRSCGPRPVLRHTPWPARYPPEPQPQQDRIPIRNRSLASALHTSNNLGHQSHQYRALMRIERRRHLSSHRLRHRDDLAVDAVRSQHAQSARNRTAAAAETPPHVERRTQPHPLRVRVSSHVHTAASAVPRRGPADRDAA